MKQYVIDKNRFVWNFSILFPNLIKGTKVFALLTVFSTSYALAQASFTADTNKELDNIDNARDPRRKNYLFNFE